MAAKALPSQEVLRQLLRYEADTGKLYRLPLCSSLLATSDKRGASWVAASFNARNSGEAAFTYMDHRGYLHGKVLGKTYQAHRVIWKLVYGFDPSQIDHINGNPSDNRISNLRECTTSQNAQNYQKQNAGTSKYRGVCWVSRDGKWAARISNGKGGKISLGNYTDEVSAAYAYDNAARKMHGEFATVNFPAAQADYEARICSALVQP